MLIFGSNTMKTHTHTIPADPPARSMMCTVIWSGQDRMLTNQRNRAALCDMHISSSQDIPFKTSAIQAGDPVLSTLGLWIVVSERRTDFGNC